MSQKNETGTLIAALVITVVILAGGFWWFTRQSGMNLGTLTGGENNSTQNPSPPTQPANPGTPAANLNSAFPPPQAVPSGTIVRIAGSTSMVQINQALKQSFEQQFQGTTVETQAEGSDQGIRTLLTGSVDIAAISRPLTSQEQSQGLVAVPVTKDAIAIVVGKANPFQRGLTQAEVQQIFQGQITNWSQVGGASEPIRVINRPPVSGTRQAFQELVLNGGQFGATPNIVTMQRDATTPILRELGSDGISYATYSQVADQQTVRIVPVDGLTPEAANYPYQRELYYVYKQPATPQVQAFLGYVGSPQGQGAIAATNQ